MSLPRTRGAHGSRARPAISSPSCAPRPSHTCILAPGGHHAIPFTVPPAATPPGVRSGPVLQGRSTPRKATLTLTRRPRRPVASWRPQQQRPEESVHAPGCSAPRRSLRTWHHPCGRKRSSVVVHKAWSRQRRCRADHEANTPRFAAAPRPVGERSTSPGRGQANVLRSLRELPHQGSQPVTTCAGMPLRGGHEQRQDTLHHRPCCIGSLPHVSVPPMAVEGQPHVWGAACRGALASSPAREGGYRG